MVVYLDSSLALRHILLGEAEIEKAFHTGPVFSSELLEIECRRVLQRYRLEGQLTDEQLITALDRLERLLKGINLMVLSSEIKKRAMGAFPVVVKTLDALHLSSALALAYKHPEKELHLFSHDRGMNLCAKALSLQAPLLEQK